MSRPHPEAEAMALVIQWAVIGTALAHGLWLLWQWATA